MKCEICDRDNLTARELAIHNKYFHSHNPNKITPISSNICPDCGGTLLMQEGCEYCNLCGYSKCG